MVAVDDPAFPPVRDIFRFMYEKKTPVPVRENREIKKEEIFFRDITPYPFISFKARLPALSSEVVVAENEPDLAVQFAGIFFEIFPFPSKVPDRIYNIFR
jgi:hypothetical protein